MDKSQEQEDLEMTYFIKGKMIFVETYLFVKLSVNKVKKGE